MTWKRTVKVTAALRATPPQCTGNFSSPRPLDTHRCHGTLCTPHPVTTSNSRRRQGMLHVSRPLALVCTHRSLCGMRYLWTKVVGPLRSPWHPYMYCGAPYMGALLLFGPDGYCIIEWPSTVVWYRYHTWKRRLPPMRTKWNAGSASAYIRARCLCTIGPHFLIHCKTNRQVFFCNWLKK